MATADNDNTANNMTTTADQQEPIGRSMPIYNASGPHHHPHSCNDPTHHHYPFLFDQADEQVTAAAAKNEMLMKRKAKKNQKQDVTRAEMIPGHQGDKSIDELVNFINGPSSTTNNANSKKSKKKSTTNN